MHCFNHNALPAVGNCKACHKGLCPDCAVDSQQGLACKDCETDVMELAEMNERSKKLYGIGKYATKVPASGVLLWGVISIILWAAVAFIFYKTRKLNLEAAIPAVIMTVIAGFAYYSSKRTGLNC